ncbi:tetratricopeptide repeat protein, partial [Bacteroidales bacterium]|nr:tetratricopeptide repeat protein [Bacteroidales bacterium]
TPPLPDITTNSIVFADIPEIDPQIVIEDNSVHTMVKLHNYARKKEKLDTSIIVSHLPPLLSDTADTTQQMLDFILDDIRQKEQIEDFETLSDDYKNIGDLYHGQNKIDMAINSYKKAADYSKKTGEIEQLPQIYNQLAIAFLDSGSYDLAIESYEEAIDFIDSTDYINVKADLLTEVAIIYETSFEHEKAIKTYNDALDIKIKQNDTEGVVHIKDNLADAYLEIKEPEKAAEFYKQNLDHYNKTGQEEQQGRVLNKLGIALYESGNYDEAIKSFEKSAVIKEKTGNKIELSISLNNIGNVNYSDNRYQKAINLYRKSIDIKDSENYDYGEAITIFNIGNAYLKTGDYKQAIQFFTKSLIISEERNYTSLKYRNYLALGNTHEEIQQLTEAIHYYKLYYESGYRFVQGEVISEKEPYIELAKNVKMVKYLQKEIRKQKLITQYETAQKQQELEIKNYQLENEREKKKRFQWILILAAIFIVSVAILAINLYKQNVSRKKANEKLIKQNELIVNQQTQITDSIYSARRIQNATLLPERFISKILDNYFILNLPRDIVSGDFYWLAEKSNHKVIAIADCTGHGVPGATMSMLGIAYMNDVVNTMQTISPDAILEELRKRVVNSLHSEQTVSQSWDGIDMALITIKDDTLKFAGANNPLLILRNHEIIELKPDRMPIGYHLRAKNFTVQEFKLEKNDMLFMFSDGIIDQLGGNAGKRFLKRRLHSILIEISDKPLSEQKEIILQQYLNWRGNNDQTDDIILMGIHID